VRRVRRDPEEAGDHAGARVRDDRHRLRATPAPTSGDDFQAGAWDRRETLVREKQSLGFYVSGHPLERYVRGEAGLAKLGATPAADCPTMDDWAPIKLVGMVEGYRERMFKDGGGKIAFFELEDLTGRVNVKVRGREIDTYAPVLTSGEPVIISGKVSFPFREDGAEEVEEGPREATILLSDARPLSDAVRADTRSIAIKLAVDKTRSSDLRALAGIFAQAKGECPVTLHLALEDGAEAVLALGRDHRVEVGDALLGGIEKLFGEQVAELR
jgi:DNA polymerase-3 subunit alpha